MIDIGQICRPTNEPSWMTAHDDCTCHEDSWNCRPCNDQPEWEKEYE